MKLNRILEAALATNVGSICLADGKVQFQTGDESREFDASPGEYDALWQRVHTLELCDFRAMAPQLLSESLQGSWTLRVYVGPNVFGKVNVVIDPLPTNCKTLSDYIDLLDASN
jgi:hypothetical protein